MLNERQRSLLLLNGIALLISSVLTGWFYFFWLLGGIELAPFIDHVDVDIPGDKRAWNMAHLEGITNGLILMAISVVAAKIRLSTHQCNTLFYSSLIFAWLFTLLAIANAIFGTRGLAYGGGAFAGGMANDIIYLSGWPPIIAVHIAFGLLAWGAWKHYQYL